MSTTNTTALFSLLRDHAAEIGAEWVAEIQAASAGYGSRMNEAELRVQCRELLAALSQALAEGGGGDLAHRAYQGVRDRLEDISTARAGLGYSPRETALLVFSLKQPLFSRLRAGVGTDLETFAREAWNITRLVDEMGLLTMDFYQKAREAIIARQQQEILELSTPVVTLWTGIVALPLIGTLDSGRTQVVMENLLQAIVTTQAEVAIIDITGVPTVDTLVAQHLIKTVSAARLMGAECIISGIRPQIAQTMVHLGVELNVSTKATLAGAFALALRQTGQSVLKAPRSTPAASAAGT